tara:strand:- start:249 stop:530 length:282 start_codon:yes stop_codon:yes gene_type:complete
MKTKGYIMRNRRKKIFDRIVNPLLLKYLAPTNESALAKNIPIKYLKYFKEISNHKNAMNIRYRYRGNSIPVVYQRPQSFCHLEGALTFAIYER